MRWFMSGRQEPVRHQVDVHFHGQPGGGAGDSEIKSLLLALIGKANTIMATQQETTAEVRAARQELASVNTQLVKIGGETAGTLAKATALEARIVELEALIAAGGNSSPELDAEIVGLKEDIAALKAQAQAADDLTPDA